MTNFAKYLACFLSCISLFLVSNSVRAAEGLSLAGAIVDQSDSPIPGATINLYSNMALLNQRQTGADGKFEFPNLLPGTYIVECSKEGFQTASRRVVLQDRSEGLRLTLEIAGLSQHVIVIASELPELPKIGRASCRERV